MNSKPTKNELLDHVVPHVTPRWYVLGLKLLKKDQETQLDIIKSNHAGDNQMCCMEMFWYWLGTNTEASWQQLVEALRSPVVKLPVVAADIEKMFTGIAMASYFFTNVAISHIVTARYYVSVANLSLYTLRIYMATACMVI